MDADKVRLGDHLDIVRTASAHPAIGDADDRDPAVPRLFDNGAGSVVHDQHADIMAAIVEGRDFGLAQHLHRIAGRWKRRCSGMFRIFASPEYS